MRGVSAPLPPFRWRNRLLPRKAGGRRARRLRELWTHHIHSPRPDREEAACVLPSRPTNTLHRELWMQPALPVLPEPFDFAGGRRLGAVPARNAGGTRRRRAEDQGRARQHRPRIHIQRAARRLGVREGLREGDSRDIPLHVTRFFPRFQMSDSHPTPVTTVRRLADVARQRLRRVLTGNC